MRSPRTGPLTSGLAWSRRTSCSSRRRTGRSCGSTTSRGSCRGREARLAGGPVIASLSHPASSSPASHEIPAQKVGRAGLEPATLGLRVRQEWSRRPANSGNWLQRRQTEAATSRTELRDAEASPYSQAYSRSMSRETTAIVLDLDSMWSTVTRSRFATGKGCGSCRCTRPKSFSEPSVTGAPRPSRRKGCFSSGSRVRLLADPATDRVDQYGRLLRSSSASTTGL